MSLLSQPWAMGTGLGLEELSSLKEKSLGLIDRQLTSHPEWQA